MVFPSYLSLAEAVDRLRELTSKPVTADWLLQHAAEKRLQLFVLLRRTICLESPKTGVPFTMHNQGSRVPLTASWAQFMLGRSNSKPTILVAVMSVENSSVPGWVCEPVDMVKAPLEISVDDLCARRADIEGLAKPEAVGEVAGSSADKPLVTKERDTLLTIIGALAKYAELDLDSTPSKAAEGLVKLTEAFGVTLSRRAIEGHLKKLAELKDRRGLEWPTAIAALVSGNCRNWRDAVLKCGRPTAAQEACRWST